MSTTIITLAVPGKESYKLAMNLIKQLGQSFSFGVTASTRTTPNYTDKIEEIPHAFAQFNTDIACANDSSWDAGTVDKNNRER